MRFIHFRCFVFCCQRIIESLLTVSSVLCWCAGSSRVRHFIWFGRHCCGAISFLFGFSYECCQRMVGVHHLQRLQRKRASLLKAVYHNIMCSEAIEITPRMQLQKTEPFSTSHRVFKLSEVRNHEMQCNNKDLLCKQSYAVILVTVTA